MFMNNQNISMGSFYVFTIIGSLIYFLQQARGFEEIFWGIVKSMFWPATLIYHLFQFLQV